MGADTKPCLSTARMIAEKEEKKLVGVTLPVILSFPFPCNHTRSITQHELGTFRIPPQQVGQCALYLMNIETRISCRRHDYALAAVMLSSTYAMNSALGSPHHWLAAKRRGDLREASGCASTTSVLLQMSLSLTVISKNFSAPAGVSTGSLVMVKP